MLDKIYSESTQKRNWIFKKSKINEICVEKYRAIGDRITGIEVIKNTKKIILHEDKLIQYFVEKLSTDISKLNLSISLKSKALSYFRRFYLKKSIIDYNPEDIMTAVLFVAMKVSEYNVDKYKFKRLIDFNEDTLFENEFILLHIMDYDMFIFCPYKAKKGFLQILINSPYFLSIIPNNDKLNDFEIKSNNFIDMSFKTNLIFTHSYSQIALASLYLSLNSISEGKIDNDLFFKSLNIVEYQNLLVLITEIENEIKTLKEIDIEEVKKILKEVNRLRKNNPVYYDNLEKRKEELKSKINKLDECFVDNRTQFIQEEIKQPLLKMKRDRENEKELNLEKLSITKNA